MNWKCFLLGHKIEVYYQEDKKRGVFYACCRCGTLNVKFETFVPKSFKDWVKLCEKKNL